MKKIHSVTTAILLISLISLLIYTSTQLSPITGAKADFLLQNISENKTVVFLDTEAYLDIQQRFLAGLPDETGFCLIGEKQDNAFFVTKIRDPLTLEEKNETAVTFSCFVSPKYLGRGHSHVLFKTKYKDNIINQVLLSNICDPSLQDQENLDEEEIGAVICSEKSFDRVKFYTNKETYDFRGTIENYLIYAET